MKKCVFVMFFSFIAVSANAAEQCSVDVKVNGLVCDFCAQALNKVFRKQPEVSDINVDLDGGVVHVEFKENQSLDDASLKKLITDSGYAVQSIEKGC
jgi:copper chaperone CopZ